MKTLKEQSVISGAGSKRNGPKVVERVAVGEETQRVRHFHDDRCYRGACAHSQPSSSDLKLATPGFHVTFCVEAVGYTRRLVVVPKWL